MSQEEKTAAVILNGLHKFPSDALMFPKPVTDIVRALIAYPDPNPAIFNLNKIRDKREVLTVHQTLLDFSQEASGNSTQEDLKIKSIDLAQILYEENSWVRDSVDKTLPTEKVREIIKAHLSVEDKSQSQALLKLHPELKTHIAHIDGNFATWSIKSFFKNQLKVTNMIVEKRLSLPIH